MLSLCSAHSPAYAIGGVADESLRQFVVTRTAWDKAQSPSRGAVGMLMATAAVYLEHEFFFERPTWTPARIIILRCALRGGQVIVAYRHWGLTTGGKPNSSRWRRPTSTGYLL